jgi:hypothetical protein
LSEVEIRGDRLRLHFRGAQPNDEHRRVATMLVQARAAEPGGMAFQAVRGITVDEEAIVLEFLPPREPAYAEVSPGRWVSCYLYPQPSA